MPRATRFVLLAGWALLLAAPVRAQVERAAARSDIPL